MKAGGYYEEVSKSVTFKCPDKSKLFSSNRETSKDPSAGVKPCAAKDSPHPLDVGAPPQVLREALRPAGGYLVALDAGESNRHFSR